MSTYCGPAFMPDTGRDGNKEKVMFFDLRKPMSSLTKEHDILVKDLEHSASFALVMVREALCKVSSDRAI